MKRKHMVKWLLPLAVAGVMALFSPMALATEITPLPEAVVVGETAEPAGETSTATTSVASEPEEVNSGMASLGGTNVPATFGGNTSSGGGISRLTIGAIVAFTLGGGGILFFIYSQFLYKARLKRKAEAAAISGQVSLVATHKRKELAEEEEEIIPSAWETTQMKKLKQQPALGETRQWHKEAVTATEPATIGNETLTEQDAKRLHAVDWDAFFKQNNL